MKGVDGSSAWSASRRTKLLACFAIVYLVWGSSYLATSIGVHHLPPRLFAGIRFVIAGTLLVAIAGAIGRRVRLDAIELRNVLVMGFLTILISNGFNNWALQWVSSGTSALLNASSALWIALLGTRGTRGHALSPRVIAGLALGFGGVALIVRPESATRELLLPHLGILLGCLGWAIGTIYYRNSGSRLDVLAFTGLQMLFGGTMLVVAGLFFGEAARWTWSGAGFAAMAYLTLLSSCVAYTAYAWLTHHAAPAQIGTYSYVNPAIATALGWWLLDEHLTGGQLLGMIVILVGVILVSWPSEDPQPEPTG